MPGRAARASTSYFFFFNDTATTEIYTLSLHDALPIYARLHGEVHHLADLARVRLREGAAEDGEILGVDEGRPAVDRSEEHTSELQSQSNLVCRLLLETNKDDAPGCGAGFAGLAPPSAL